MRPRPKPVSSSSSFVVVRVRIEVHVEGIVVAVPEQAVVPSRVEHREVQRELTRALQRGPMRVRAAKPFADACAGSRDVRHATLEVVERRVHPARREFERWCVAKERARLIAGPFRERRGAPRDGLALSKQRVFGVEEPCEHRGRRREGFVVPAAAEWAVRGGAEWGREGFDEGFEVGVHRTLVASLMMSEEEGEASEVTSDDSRTCTCGHPAGRGEMGRSGSGKGRTANTGGTGVVSAIVSMTGSGCLPRRPAGASRRDPLCPRTGLCPRRFGTFKLRQATASLFRISRGPSDGSSCTSPSEVGARE